MKGQLGGLSDSVVALGVTAIVIAFVALVLSQVKTQVTSIAGANSVAENATTAGITAMGTYGTWLPIVAIVTVAGVILALLYYYMMGRAHNA